mgnify:CR=1 FL=1
MPRACPPVHTPQSRGRRFLPRRRRAGLDAGQVEIVAGSGFVDRPLGETRARTRTGASIVAIVRDEQVLASPGPAEVLHAGDVLVVIGTQDGIAGVQNIVDQG